MVGSLERYRLFEIVRPFQIQLWCQLPFLAEWPLVLEKASHSVIHVTESITGDRSLKEVWFAVKDAIVGEISGEFVERNIIYALL